MTRPAHEGCALSRGERVENCILGCDEAACCENTKQGTEEYQCLLQMLQRIGDDPEPGQKCGSCGITIT